MSKNIFLEKSDFLGIFSCCRFLVQLVNPRDLGGVVILNGDLDGI